MMIERSKARKQALHILYQREITGEGVEHIMRDGSYSREEGELLPFALVLAEGVEQHQSGIDDLLGRISEHWTVARMPLVDRNILRIAAYEIVYADDVPVSVSINEAVELAKLYGGEDSSKFVNGVLGRLADSASRMKEGWRPEDVR